MLVITKKIYNYLELMATLAWKNVMLRHIQPYLGIACAIFNAQAAQTK